MNIPLNRTLYWLGKIDNENQKKIIDRVLALEHESPGQPITLFITSPGGALDPALAFFDMMRLLKINLTTIGSGIVHSAAFTIWMAGIHRFLTPHTVALFHPTTRSIDASLNKREMEIDVELMEVETLFISDIVKSVSGDKAVAERVVALRKELAVLLPSGMVTLGLAHGILDVA